MDAFQLCPLGEDRLNTTGKVLDVEQYIRRAHMFSNQYDEEHVQLSKYYPCFKIADLPGAALKVVGVLQPNCDLQEAEDMRTDPSKISTYFFRILNNAIQALPKTTRTRRHNLVLTTEMTSRVPVYYRVYPEDISVLSSHVRRLSRSLPPGAPYRFWFFCHKYGLQLKLQPGPLTVEGCGLSAVVRDARKVDCASIHLAVEFRCQRDGYSPFWRLEQVASFLGSGTDKFPFMGLMEIGNASCTSPRLDAMVADGWPEESAQNIHPTYAQAYTPTVKAYTPAQKGMKDKKPFWAHPFLLSILLGKDYVASRKAFQGIKESTAQDADYLSFKEAVALQVEETKARFEVAITTRLLPAILEVNLTALADNIAGSSIIVQIPTAHMVGYCNSLMDELYAPLMAAHRGDLEGKRGELSTVLLCESLLAMLPSGSLKDMPYSLFKEYGIVPMTSGSMGRAKHLSLRGCVRLEGGLLYVPRRRVRKIFVPLEGIGTGGGKKEAYNMLQFLDTMKTRRRGDIATRAAHILVDQFVADLVRSRQVSSRRVLTDAAALVNSGCTVRGFVDSKTYVSRALDLSNVPRRGAVYGFLKVAVALTSQDRLSRALAKSLSSRLKFVPRATLHEGTRVFNVSLYDVVCPRPLAAVAMDIRSGEAPQMEKTECMPLLDAARVDMIESFHLTNVVASNATK